MKHKRGRKNKEDPKMFAKRKSPEEESGKASNWVEQLFTNPPRWKNGQRDKAVLLAEQQRQKQSTTAASTTASLRAVLGYNGVSRLHTIHHGEMRRRRPFKSDLPPLQQYHERFAFTTSPPGRGARQVGEGA